MAEPKTEIEQRLDRLERAVGILARWVIDVDKGIDPENKKDVESILTDEDLLRL